ncbi:hypothetical protein B0H21DRAFT_356523 [Amylocystis lapponica]|nr:hypothetical protein B0H21DRAFT_356523 [Amylocystis lapponica]
MTSKVTGYFQVLLSTVDLLGLPVTLLSTGPSRCSTSCGCVSIMLLLRFSPHVNVVVAATPTSAWSQIWTAARPTRGSVGNTAQPKLSCAVHRIVYGTSTATQADKVAWPTFDEHACACAVALPGHEPTTNYNRSDGDRGCPIVGGARRPQASSPHGRMCRLPHGLSIHVSLLAVVSANCKRP